MDLPLGVKGKCGRQWRRKKPPKPDFLGLIWSHICSTNTWKCTLSGKKKASLLTFFEVTEKGTLMFSHGALDKDSFSD